MALIIGICTLELDLNDSHSLKDKRQVVRSVLDRARGRFNVSIAQLDQHDLWQHATIGIACVGNERQYVNTVLNKVLELLESEPRVEVTGCQMEML